MDTIKFDELTIGEIVANDFRASTVFKDAGIDFCCGGKQTLTVACKEKGIVKEDLLNELASLDEESISPSENFKEWEIGFLSDYIVNTHHRYVKKKLPEITFYTEKISSVHGDHHPELIEVANIFSDVVTELTQHLQNEEEVLFPAIKELLLSGSEASKVTIIDEITRMSDEHDFAGGEIDKINEITNGYLLPEDACNTYKVAFTLLKQFEDDLHIHIHLENNILFPKSLELAKQ